VAHTAESLAGRTSEDQVDLTFNSSELAYALPTQRDDRLTDGLPVGKIPLMSRDVMAVCVDSKNDLESRLLKAQGHAPGAAE